MSEGSPIYNLLYFFSPRLFCNVHPRPRPPLPNPPQSVISAVCFFKRFDEPTRFFPHPTPTGCDFYSFAAGHVHQRIWVRGETGQRRRQSNRRSRPLTPRSLADKHDDGRSNNIRCRGRAAAKPGGQHLRVPPGLSFAVHASPRAPLERPFDPPNDQGSPSPVGRRDVARGIHGVFDGRGGGPRRPPERGIAAGLLLQRPLVSERGLGLVSRRKARGANPRDSIHSLFFIIAPRTTRAPNSRPPHATRSPV